LDEGLRSRYNQKKRESGRIHNVGHPTVKKTRRAGNFYFSESLTVSREKREGVKKKNEYTIQQSPGGLESGRRSREPFQPRI